LGLGIAPGPTFVFGYTRPHVVWQPHALRLNFPTSRCSRYRSTSGSLTAEATVMTASRRVVHLEARTLDDDSNLIASATGSFAVIAPRDQ